MGDSRTWRPQLANTNLSTFVPQIRFHLEFDLKKQLCADAYAYVKTAFLICLVQPLSVYGIDVTVQRTLSSGQKSPLIGLHNP